MHEEVIARLTPASSTEEFAIRTTVIGNWWLVSLSQSKNKKPEISAPQAVCDVVSAAPLGCCFKRQNLSVKTNVHELIGTINRSKFWLDHTKIWLCH